MKRFILFALLIVTICSLTAAAQQKPKPKSAPARKPAAPVVALDEKTEFDKAVAVAAAEERIAALLQFSKNFPASENKTRVLELIVSARAEIGEAKLRAAETEAGVKMFKLAAEEAPTPVSEVLFGSVLLQFPTNLFFRGQQAAAVEVARIIEEKTEGNAKQTLGLATFYLGIENGNEAKRLADKAIGIDPAMPAAYQTLGLANRMNFDLDEAVNAYAKALELDPASIVSKRSLAEMKRAAGKPSEALALYREILDKDAADNTARTGLILSLFDAEKTAEAESELAKALEANPNNLVLLVGAAYHYAATKQSLKAVELAQKAVAVEPRYTWAYIALARGYMGQNNPADAEKALLAARQYGNFPTLDYETANVRAAAGFYEEAARDLLRSFTLTKGDTIKTRLGNRIVRDETSFIALLAPERRSGIFQPLAADNAQNAEFLKSLLRFAQKTEEKTPDETEVVEAAENFAGGTDSTRAHRQIYAANRLLNKKIALSEAYSLAQSAVRGVEPALEISAPTSFVLADELLPTRAAAMERGQLIVVPDIPRRTLSDILRGRIEEISGWSLYEQKKYDEAAVRLKRAVDILPEKSVWRRSSGWRLGATLEAAGKDQEALNAYIASYTSSDPDATRLSVIETVYRRLNGGSLDGLESRLAEKPQTNTNFLIKAADKSTVSKTEPINTPAPTIVAKVETSTTPEKTPAPTPEPTVVTPEAIVSPTPQIIQTPLPEPSPAATPESTPTATPAPTPEATPTATPEIVPTPVPTPDNSTLAENRETQSVVPAPQPVPTPKTEEIPPTDSNDENAGRRRYEVVVTDTIKTPTSSENKPKPLFESVVIDVPKLQAIKPIAEPLKDNDIPTLNIPDRSNGEGNEKNPVRDRVVNGESDAVEPNCSLVVSQETVDLLNNGGTLGVLVNYADFQGDLSKITAVSNSPDDVTVNLDPEIGKQSKRAFFIVSSISPKVGIYTLSFNSPCGTRRVQVRVR